MNELHKQYNQKKRESEKTTQVTLTTAIQADEKELKKITHTLEKKLGNKVELKVIVDKSLIGGAVIQTGDHMVDGAVSTQLQSLNRFLIN
jgi:F-type H+-transporting ATPase subunit delta